MPTTPDAQKALRRKRDCLPKYCFGGAASEDGFRAAAGATGAAGRGGGAGGKNMLWNTTDGVKILQPNVYSFYVSTVTILFNSPPLALAQPTDLLRAAALLVADIILSHVTSFFARKAYQAI